MTIDFPYDYLRRVLDCGHTVMTATDKVMSATTPEEVDRGTMEIIKAAVDLNDAKFALFHAKGGENSEIH